MSNATPPGWYPDVGSPGAERWWDGTAWTAHTRPTSAARASAPVPTDTRGGATGGDAPADDPKVLVDQLNGISLTVPDGWEEPESTIDDATTMRTVGSYTCPGDSGSHCYHGTVTSRTASSTDLTSAEALAKADIGVAADNAYEENAVAT